MAKQTKNCVQGYKSTGECCLTALNFLQSTDINLTTDIFIVIDPSVSFEGTREYVAQEVNTWYVDFRLNNPDHSANVYLYKGVHDTPARLNANSKIEGITPLIGTPTSNILVEDINLPYVTALVEDGYTGSGDNGTVANEAWLSYPRIISRLSSEFTGLSYKDPNDILFIFIGDECTGRGARYHGCVEFNGSSNCATMGVINGIQTTVLSEPTYGLGYKEDYESFTQNDFSNYSFFKGIVYGLTTFDTPWSDSNRVAFHSHIYQAIENGIVSESEFIESSYAEDSLGDTTGFSLDFIKTTNYLADLGYAGLKNYGWRELHDVGYGDISESFTSAIFQLNIERALLSTTKVVLEATLSNGVKISSNELDLVDNKVAVNERDINPGYLQYKVLAGTNINIAVNNDYSISINSTVTSDVNSVNTKTGEVVLNPDDLDDTSTTHKFTTTADIDKLSGIEEGAQVNTVTSVNNLTGDVVIEVVYIVSDEIEFRNACAVNTDSICIIIDSPITLSSSGNLTIRPRSTVILGCDLILDDNIILVALSNASNKQLLFKNRVLVTANGAILYANDTTPYTVIIPYIGNYVASAIESFTFTTIGSQALNVFYSDTNNCLLTFANNAVGVKQGHTRPACNSWDYTSTDGITSKGNVVDGEFTVKVSLTLDANNTSERVASIFPTLVGEARTIYRTCIITMESALIGDSSVWFGLINDFTNTAGFYTKLGDMNIKGECFSKDNISVQDSDYLQDTDIPVLSENCLITTYYGGSLGTEPVATGTMVSYTLKGNIINY